MRYATIPAWVYVMLIVMGIGFMGGAIPFVLFVPAPAGGLVGVIWLLMGAGFVFFSLRALARRRDDQRILQSGIAGTATVLSADMTGLTINNFPQWKLRLRIEGAGAPYENTIKLLTYNPPANGATLGVRIDPLHHDRVVLSDDAPADSAPVTVPANVVLPHGLDAAAVSLSLLKALRTAGLTDDATPGATTVTTNADGSRTIMTTSVQSGAPNPAADTVR